MAPTEPLLRRWAPSPPLRALVDRAYVGFRQPAHAHERWLATPGTSVTVILNAGSGFNGLPRHFAAGLIDTAAVIDQAGEIECLDLKLTPLGAYTLLGVPMDELTNASVDVGDLLPGADRVTDAPSWAERFEALDRLLLDRAEHGPRPAPEVTEVYRRLVSSAGSPRIGALAEEVGWSRRHLVSKFRQQVGLPPKTLARIARFQHLLSRLGPGPDWTRLAAECGYYDQAHLNRDFREFAGTTPTGYLSYVQYGRTPAA